MDPLSTLTATTDFEQPLREILAIASRVMPDRPHVSVALRREDSPVTVASSGAEAAAYDALQFRAGAGPCLEAISTGEPVLSADLTAESRWSGPAAELAALGVRALHAEPLRLDGQVLGVLTLYSGEPGPLPAETRVAARVTAGQVEVLFRTAMQAARLNTMIVQLREALTTRAIIDQALGIIMARRLCTAPAAFEVLRRSSQNRNVKVHRVAAEIVEAVTGQPPLPPSFGDPPPARGPTGPAARSGPFSRA